MMNLFRWLRSVVTHTAPSGFAGVTIGWAQSPLSAFSQYPLAIEKTNCIGHHFLDCIRNQTGFDSNWHSVWRQLDVMLKSWKSADLLFYQVEVMFDEIADDG